MSVLSIWPLNWWAASTKGLEMKGAVVFSEPEIFISGAAAGVAGRLAAMPFAPPGEKGFMHTVYRRAPQMGMFFWMYVPLQAAVTQEFFDPGQKAFSTAYMGALAGFWMRFWNNPLGRIHEEARRMDVSFSDAAKIMKNKGILHFWYCAHPLLANMAYFAALAVGFEGSRRFLERSGMSVNETYENAAVCAAAGAMGSTFATVASYPFSYHRYSTTVIHDSVINRGLFPTLLKEVPMMSVTFGTFALINSYLAPHHGPRAGFGY